MLVTTRNMNQTFLKYTLVFLSAVLIGVSFFLASCDVDSQNGQNTQSVESSQDKGNKAKQFAEYSDPQSQKSDSDLQSIKSSSPIQFPLPFLATYDGVDIRSLVKVDAITGVLFHQASYDYAFPLETQLPEADYEKANETRTIPHNPQQKYDNNSWLDASVLRLWRMNATTPINTSIDLGGRAGETVYAPIDGTVVHICEYDLFDQMKDIEIHIQPDGREDLDCVLIHITDALVKEGDSVVAGTTPVAHIRDIDSELTDVQLGYYTPEGVGGNHVHVQMNNANYPEYREKKLTHH